MNSKKIILLICFNCVLFAKVFSQDVNGFAIEYSQVKPHMDLIKEFVTGKNADCSLRRVESIYFLETLTGIEGSGDGTYFGKFSVDFTDYVKWDRWISKYMYYDFKEKKIKVLTRGFKERVVSFKP